MKTTKRKSPATPLGLPESESGIRSSIAISPSKLVGNSPMIFRSKGTTRWQRFKNIVLFAWRYVMTGTARL